jgi:hypothetical protein
LKQHLWKDESACLGLENNLFFDKYEDDAKVRPIVDSICMSCPVKKTCFAVGVSGKEWGVWGGIYLEGGDISREFNNHKTKSNWANTWEFLTMEK